RWSHVRPPCPRRRRRGDWKRCEHLLSIWKTDALAPCDSSQASVRLTRISRALSPTQAFQPVEPASADRAPAQGAAPDPAKRWTVQHRQKLAVRYRLDWGPGLERLWLSP